MPTEDEYGRRQQITIQHASISPAPVTCPAGCPSATQIPDRYPASYGSEKTLSDRFEPPERFQSERFGSERSHSDRLPSGERYHGVSERYPLGERPQTAVSSERLSKELLQAQTNTGEATPNKLQPERYHYSERPATTTCQNQRYPDRLTPVQSNIGSLDRYHNTNLERYSRTNTPTDRYQTLSATDKERSSSTSSDRYTPTPDKYTASNEFNTSSGERHSSTQSVCSDRYTPTERHTNTRPDVYHNTSNASKTLPPEMYKYKDRSGERKPSDRYNNTDRYQNRYGHEYVQDRFNTGDRFPPIPCPERFATQDRNSERIFTPVPYMEPPSPAPASDRFIPPPPLSPTNTPSPDCYPSNPFPSPTNNPPTSDTRFIPPPPLSPSPTENYSPKTLERYEKSRYPERYSNQSPNPNDRYAYQQYKDRYYNNERYGNNPQNYHPSDKYLNVSTTERYANNDRYIPPNAHMPVERYVPQPQEPYYQTYQAYDRFQKFNSSDPYMRRDLAFHYRLPVPYPAQNQYQQRMRYVNTPNRMKCCQYQDGYQLSKSSPGSSSSSSVTSQGKDIQNFHAQQQQTNKEVNTSLQDIQCQNYPKEYQPCRYTSQQEKAVQCNQFCNKDVQCAAGFHISPQQSGNKDVAVKDTFTSPNLRKTQCRHSICASPSVEYMGGSGGRHVSATPPPRGSIGSGDGSVCSDQCCPRKAQNSLTVAVWRSTPTNQQQQPSQQQNQQPAVPQQQQQQQQQHQTPPQSHQSPQPSTKQTPSPPGTSHNSTEQLQSDNDQQNQIPQAASPPKPSAAAQRAVSLPVSPPEPRQQQQQRAVNYSQSERNPRDRPRLARSTSRKEMIKNYIKKETATFFGVCEDNETIQQERWLDRRKRLASRKYGELKEDYQLPSNRLRRVVSEVTHGTSGQLQRERPDVLPGPSDVPDSSEAMEEETRSKDSVARMTWDGLSYVVTTLTRHQQRPRSQQWSRSFPPDVPNTRSSLEDNTFFARPSSPVSPTTPPYMVGDATDRGSASEADAMEPLHESNIRWLQSGGGPGWRRDPHTVARNEQTRPTVGGTRIYTSLLDRVLDNSDRRQYGMGWVGKMFGRSLKKSVTNNVKIRQQLEDLEDYRPLFTYWVTTVQILVLIISIMCYGFGPFGLDLQARSGQVLVPSLSLQQVDYMEPANFWFGPRAADLIHLGAKFAPCMRVDDKIHQQIEKNRAKERETACCIRNDDSGCVQSSQADCSKAISTWKKWSAGESGPGGRISGSVCGLDPKFCDAPASVHPYEWPDDITKWPICRKPNTQFSIQKRGPRDKIAEHMVCEVIGHPCCIGIHGQCRITTQEYCDFVRGTFHEEASLCAQVSCLNDVCGMIPFYFFEVPDQFYRLWTSIFLHAGILQLCMTVIVQYFLMRDLEKLTGSLRIGIIYIGSGVAGNLASAIFVPYRADVGPAGSQFGLLACLIVEVLNSWPMLRHPNQALLKLLSITGFLFVIGLLPWVDNYAHLFGFVFGFLLSYALLPFVSFGPYDRHKKVVLIWVCLLSAGFLFICLVLLFYIIPVYDCRICSYFNCLPLTQDFCASQNINFMREEPVV